ncbi:MAG: synthase subunit delta [Burkholderiales bacterium]|jgi:F-type H+-transporting ATPase subunit delta|nr:synthase subunit delta [Burkholderiales bacterium]
MADTSSLAHPYANAVFALAKSHNNIDSWLEDLSILAQAVKSKDFINLIDNPKISASDITATLVGLTKSPNKLLANFLTILQENNRLTLLGDIFILFEKMAQDEQNTSKAVILSAFPMDEKDKTEIEQQLSKKFGRKIVASVEVQSELIGGIKILINDKVIDASVKSSLSKMAAQIIQ